MRNVHVAGFVVTLFFSFAALAHADALSDLLNALSGNPVPAASVSEPAAQAAESSTLLGQVPQGQETPVSGPAYDEKVASLKALILTLTQQVAALLQAKQAKESEVVAPSSSDSIDITGTGICEMDFPVGYGLENDNVRAVQRFLIAHQYLPEGSDVGFFGKLTEGAVKKWQAANGIVTSGTPSTTGYGYVGEKTLVLMQRTCPIDSKDAIDPTSSDAINLLAEGTVPQNLKISFEISGSEFQRGDKMFVKVAVIDPAPYMGTYIDFVQADTKNATPFASRIYLPVGFSGTISHVLNASHVDVGSKVTGFGTRSVQLKALAIAKFRDAKTGDVAERPVGESETRAISVSDDVSSDVFIVKVNDAEIDETGAWKEKVKAGFRGNEAAALEASLFAETFSRADAIEVCSRLATMLTEGISFTCEWGKEDVVKEVPKTKVIPVSAVPIANINSRGTYFFYQDGVAMGLSLSVYRETALKDCASNHSERKTSSVRCVWNNEVIYDRGPLDTFVELPVATSTDVVILPALQ
jgi:peptidoglycan hydrolase-like protein with peptidoglycan-binding domain